MARIQPLAIEAADPTTAATLQAVKTKIGMVPNLFATLERAPAALNGYLALSDALSKGRLSARQREIVALTVAQANQCQYCLSAHTLIGKGAGLLDDAIRDARAGKSSDPQDHAIAVLASKLVKQQGNLSQADLNTAHAAGIDEGLVLEIVVNVAFNVLTNYTNHVAETDIDFPVVQMAL